MRRRRHTPAGSFVVDAAAVTKDRFRMTAPRSLLMHTKQMALVACRRIASSGAGTRGETPKMRRHESGLFQPCSYQLGSAPAAPWPAEGPPIGDDRTDAA